MNSFVYNFFYVNFLVYPALLVPIDSSRTIFINGSKPRKTPSTVIPVGSLTRTFLSMNFLSSGGWAAAMLISFTRKNKLLFPRIKNWLEITWMKWIIKIQKRFFLFVVMKFSWIYAWPYCNPSNVVIILEVRTNYSNILNNSV